MDTKDLQDLHCKRLTVLSVRRISIEPKRAEFRQASRNPNDGHLCENQDHRQEVVYARVSISQTTVAPDVCRLFAGLFPFAALFPGCGVGASVVQERCSSPVSFRTYLGLLGHRVELFNTHYQTMDSEDEPIGWELSKLLGDGWGPPPPQSWLTETQAFDSSGGRDS